MLGGLNLRFLFLTNYSSEIFALSQWDHYESCFFAHISIGKRRAVDTESKFDEFALKVSNLISACVFNGDSQRFKMSFYPHILEILNTLRSYI